jgi:hypothetical protein
MSKEDLDRLNDLNPRRKQPLAENGSCQVSTPVETIEEYLKKLPGKDVTSPGKIVAISGARPSPKRSEQLDLPLV